MTKIEIMTFIEEMGIIGDIWTEEEVKSSYGDVTLIEALDTRKAEMGQFLSAWGTAAIYMAHKEDE